MLHRAGYRFRKNVKELPGKPDIVLPKYKTVIFVHGCFWHRHRGCKDATMPKSNIEFWQNKFDRNVSNDRKHTRQLRRLGWHVLTVWSCELKNSDKVLAKLQKLLPADHAEKLVPPKAGIVQYPTGKPQRLRSRARIFSFEKTEKGAVKTMA